MSDVITDTHSPILAESLIQKCAFDFSQCREVHNVEVAWLRFKETKLCMECSDVRIQLWYKLLFALQALV